MMSRKYASKKTKKTQTKQMLNLFSCILRFFSPTQNKITSPSLVRQKKKETERKKRKRLRILEKYVQNVKEKKGKNTSEIRK